MIADRLRHYWWRLVFTGTGGLTVTGTAPAGACVFVANHNSHADAPALLAALPASSGPTVAAAADYWFASRWRSQVCRGFVSGFAVRRGGGGSADLAAAASMLAAGRSVIVFAEGTRSRDGRLGAFHSGAMRLASGAGVPVVPVAMAGTAALLPAGGRPRLSRVQVRIGEAMTDPEAADVRSTVAKMMPSSRAETTDVGSAPSLASGVRRIASRPTGPAIVAGWALAEGLSWPIVPEFVIVLLALSGLRWRRLAVLTATATAGSILGCLLTFLLAAAGHTPPEPFVTSRMQLVAGQQTGRDGANAVSHQAWSGIPVKVYAAAAGRGHVPIGRFALELAVDRFLRLLTVMIAAVAVGSLVRSERIYPLLAPAAVALYLVGLHRVILHWS